MLIVLAHNVTKGEDLSISEYDVQVRINERVIWKGRVGEHVRAEGWQTLLHKIADKGIESPQ